MRHNSHVFEPEVLEKALVQSVPAVTCSRWYSTHRPRTGLVIQGLRHSGKTTMCNAILGGGLLPYFHNLPGYMVPSVVVDWSVGSLVDPVLATSSEGTMIDLELFSRPLPSAPPAGMSSRENSNRSFSSRSVSDSMVREVLESAPLSSREGSLSRQDLIDVLAPLIHIRSPIRDEIVQHRSIGPFVEQLSKSEGLVAEMERAVFLRVTLNPTDASGRDADAPSPLFRIVESQSVEDRPALHLVHTMVFVMAQDEAFAHRRPPGHSWDDRHSALVASMSAINTCDGKNCKPCLVVNIGHDVFSLSPTADESCEKESSDGVESIAKQTSEDEFVLVDYPLADDMIRIPIEHTTCIKSAESPVNGFFSDEDSLHATRASLARKWRLPEKNVYFFSAQLILAHRVVSRISQASNPLGLHPLHLREYDAFCEFVESNRSLGISEWENKRNPMKDTDISCTPRGNISKEPVSSVCPGKPEKTTESTSEEKRCENASISYPFTAAPSNDPRVVTFASHQEAKDEALRRELVAKEKQRKEEVVKIMREVQSDQLDVARRVASQ